MDTIRALLFCTPPMWKSPYIVGFFGFSHTNTCSSRLFIHAHPVDFRPLTAKHPSRPTLKSCARWGNRVRDGSNRVRDRGNRVRDGVIVCEMGISCARWGNRVQDGVIVCKIPTSTNWNLYDYPLRFCFNIRYSYGSMHPGGKDAASSVPEKYLFPERIPNRISHISQCVS